MASLESVGDNTNIDENSFVITNTTDVEENASADLQNKEVADGDEPSEIDKGSGIIRIPLARIKKIMKADPTLGIVSHDSVFLIAKATELFIESLVVESYQNMVSSKKKTLSRRDFDSCVESIDSLAFLDGALDD